MSDWRGRETWISYRGEEAERNKTLAITPALRAYLDQERRRDESDESLLWRLLGWAQGEGVDTRTSRLYAFLKTRPFRGRGQLTARYLALLGFLYQQDPSLFEERVLPVRKRQRVYFARSRVEIDDSGRSAQPRPIPESNLWALTNMRADRKLEILDRVLVALDYGDASRQQIQTAITVDIRQQVR